MKEKVYRKLVELSNGKMSSKVLKKFSTAKLSKAIIPSYIKVFNIDTSDVSNEQREFKSLHQFFIRTLKDHARPVAIEPHLFASPVDAKIESFGTIEDNISFVVKGKNYLIEDLLGNKEQAENYQGGQYIVFYLSPADYHRMHSPMDGKVVKQYVLGQKSYPVNQLGLTYGKNPLSHNYRMISEIQYNEEQRYAFIKVGAMFVNSIELTNTSTQWRKGEEIGYFTFGSTVVMLFEKNAIQFSPNVVQGASIKMGEAFAIVL